MAPTRTQKRPLRRLSSLVLPITLLPSLSLRERLHDANPKLRDSALASEEVDRAKMNKEVCETRALALASPQNTGKATHARWSKEDYEDLYGKFIPDDDNEVWHARKDTAYAALVVLREGLTHCLFAVYSSHIHDCEKLLEYFAAEDAFHTEFGAAFEVDDGHDHPLQLKCLLTQHHTELMHRAGGDYWEAFEIAAEPFTYVVVNPFPGDNERRVELDEKFRAIYACYRIDRKPPWFPTVGHGTFVFDLPNTYGELDERRLEYWCHWDIESYMQKAREDAALPKPAPRVIPPSIFYGLGAPGLY
ncbi:hypothetical protein FB451DRAFT_1163915 [Mycena latifolia]|nr:hypothetical protein FB451DRAFT_1163915 [Mycena latifolia]